MDHSEGTKTEDSVSRLPLNTSHFSVPTSGRVVLPLSVQRLRADRASTVGAGPPTAP